MKKVTLYIESGYEKREVALEDELSIGRGDAARIVFDDEGLSRLNTTFFRDGEDVLVVDENSTNGTFINGKKISGAPRLIFDGDEITLGNYTRIRVAIGEKRQPSAIENLPPAEPKSNEKKHAAKASKQTANDESNKPPMVVIAAVGMIILIVFGTVVGLFLSGSITNEPNSARRNTPKVNTSIPIPIPVVDPMGGGEEDDNLDDLISAWEVQEAEIKVEDVAKVTSTATTGEEKKESDLNVSIEFYKKQMDLARNHGNPGNPDPPGLKPLPPEMIGGNVSKQKAKLAEMIKRDGYKQPMDFADLAEHRLSGDFLVELPMATKTYVLDIGGSATENEFTSFDFDTGSTKLTPDSPDYKILKRLADNFEGQKYDLNNPRDRKQIRIRLLRMYNKQARKVLEEIAQKYYDKFKVPLRFSSLTRSMDYQIILNGNNPNSFVVRGKGSLPPHTSGCAVDIPRRTLTAEEQNFLVDLFVEMERANKIDALREGASNPCFHFFIYPDGKPAAAQFAEIFRNNENVAFLDVPLFDWRSEHSHD